MVFFHAYALYKLERHVEAARALGPPKDGEEVPVQHLRAQIAYKRGAYGEAAGVYRGVVEGLQGEGEEVEVLDLQDAQLNLLAALVSGGMSGVEAMAASPTLGSAVRAVLEGKAEEAGLPYEFVYNVGCALIDRGDTGGAARALEQALVAGAAFAREGGGGDAEVEVELAPVRAQAALLLAGAHSVVAVGAFF